jgi:hypothetical protein
MMGLLSLGLTEAVGKGVRVNVGKMVSSVNGWGSFACLCVLFV